MIIDNISNNFLALVNHSLISKYLF